MKACRALSLSIARVTGYGDSKNLFAAGRVDPHAWLDVHATTAEAGRVVRALVRAACTGSDDDSFIAVLPGGGLYRISTGAGIDLGQA